MKCPSCGSRNVSKTRNGFAKCNYCGHEGDTYWFENPQMAAKITVVNINTLYGTKDKKK